MRLVTNLAEEIVGVLLFGLHKCIEAQRPYFAVYNQSMFSFAGFRTFIILFIAVTGTCRSQTKQPSVSIGGHDISLGMPINSALTMLREGGKVEPVAEVPVSRWIVFNKQNEPIAFVKAEGNTVASVSFLLLGRTLTSAQDMFDAIFTATAKLKSLSKDALPCEMTTTSEYDADAGSTETVNFYCGRSSKVPLGTYRIKLRRSVPKNDQEGNASFDVWGEIGEWPPTA
jgi:hypothetical protein